MAHTHAESRWLGRLARRLHPEGIPWPASLIYNAVSRSRIFQKHYRLVAEDVGAQCREGLILDIGTGPAWLPLALCRALPKVRVVGVDVSAGMVEQARSNVRRAKLSDRITIQRAAAAQLPCPDEEFDLVVSTGSFHHFKDAAAAINEVYRMLKPGRTALIYDLVRELPPERSRALRHEYGAFRVRLLQLHSFEEPFYAPQDMEHLAASTRFGGGHTRFVGALCCLELAKPARG